MSYIVGSLPPIKCWIKREFLYNFEKGHGELEPAIWVSLKALRGQVFRIESLLPNYGALPETCSEFATMIEFNPTLDLVNSFADALNNVMDNYKAGVYREDICSPISKR